MELGIVLFVIKDGTIYLESKGLLRPDGSFGTFTPQNDVELAGVIETSLKNHGVNVPSQVDKAMQILPLVLSLAGVK